MHNPDRVEDLIYLLINGDGGRGLYFRFVLYAGTPNQKLKVILCWQVVGNTADGADGRFDPVNQTWVSILASVLEPCDDPYPPMTEMCFSCAISLRYIFTSLEVFALVFNWKSRASPWAT